MSNLCFNFCPYRYLTADDLKPFYLFILFNYDETFRKLKYLLFASQPIPAQLFITLV